MFCSAPRWDICRVRVCAYVVDVCLHFEVLQPFLHERDKRAGRDVIAIDARLVYERFVAEGERRMREACSTLEVSTAITEHCLC